MKRKQIPLYIEYMPKSLSKPLLEELFSGRVMETDKLNEFEKIFGKWIGNENVAIVNNCTSGLHMSYRMVLEDPGDEIISSPVTFYGANSEILNAGGKIVWADVDPETGLIDPNDIEKRITKRTKAIFYTHWSGNVADIDGINKVAEKHGLKTIADAAHGQGALYKGKHLGNCTADFVVYSFQAAKHVTTGDGGAVAFKSPRLCEQARVLRWYGMNRDKRDRYLDHQYTITSLGYRFFMNEIAATIGIEMMKHIDTVVKKYRENAKYYDRHLKVETYKQNPDGRSSYWLYLIKVPGGRVSEFIEYMEKNRVYASQVHARNDHIPVFKDSIVNLPGVSAFYEKMCAIPVGWWLGEKDLEYIVHLVNNFR